MARKAIVSRAVEVTEVTVLGLAVSSQEPATKVYTLSGNYRKWIPDKDKPGKNGKPAKKAIVDEKKILRDIQSTYDTSDYKNIQIVGIKGIRKLYGMWEQDFINNAMELDPVTRRPVNQPK